MHTLGSARFAAHGILTILSLMVVYHICIIVGLVPYEMVWGGRLKTVQQMLSFEAVSIVANVLMLVVVAIYAGYLPVRMNRLVLKTLLWGMAALFLLNTAGNLASTNELEKLIFTPLTLLLSFFSLVLAIRKEPKAVV